jgi:hypothetical protein
MVGPRPCSSGTVGASPDPPSPSPDQSPAGVAANHRPAAGAAARWGRPLDQRQRRVDLAKYQLRQQGHREFTRVTDVDRLGVAAFHQPDHPLDQIIQIAETARLAGIDIQRQRFAFKRLHDEVAHHPIVDRQHARPVGAEHAHQADLNPMHALVLKTQTLNNAFIFVAGAADGECTKATLTSLRLRCTSGSLETSPIHFKRGDFKQGQKGRHEAKDGYRDTM